jgi:PiT family inorganic phosphate transporter
MKSHPDIGRVSIAVLFLIGILIFSLSTSHISNSWFLALAAVFGGYMAMNIGANDVANNVGPADGSNALTMTGAIIIAVIFEASGAFIAGGDVVSTIKKGIIDINAFEDNTQNFLWAMMAALLAAALWLNVATIAKAPVSTTHSIVGGVMGAGIAAAGFGIVDWETMAKIASSWVISPVIGGVIAAAFLFAIKKSITYQQDKVSASYTWVPVFVSIMAWAFTTYLVLKGLKKVWPDLLAMISLISPITIEAAKKPTFLTALSLGFIVAIITFLLVRRSLKGRVSKLENNRDSVNLLFTIPLIFAAALLSFAHGANDVANAIGPLAAINDAVFSGGIHSKASIPIWVMAVGAFGIAIGLALYGPRLIRTVGGEITELDQMRAFSIAMAAAITVIIASQLGLPVSSTHIAIGGIFGVGFLREWLEVNNSLEEDLEQGKAEIKDEKSTLKSLQSELKKFKKKKKKNLSKSDHQRIAKLYELIDKEQNILAEVKRALKKDQKTLYVRRGMIKKIITAWLITVPAAAILAAGIFYMIRGMLV